jgi:hypothetical protein
VVVGFNLANLSLFIVEIPGPERFFADRPILLTTTILAQIVVTLLAVWWGARRSASPPAPPIEASSAPLMKQAQSGAPAG